MIYLALMLMLTLLLPAGAQFMPLRSSVENYWDVTGSPQLEASVVGTNEFNRGDRATLRVALNNIGQITEYAPDEKPEDRKGESFSGKGVLFGESQNY